MHVANVCVCSPESNPIVDGDFLSLGDDQIESSSIIRARTERAVDREGERAALTHVDSLALLVRPLSIRIERSESLRRNVSGGGAWMRCVHRAEHVAGPVVLQRQSGILQTANTKHTMKSTTVNARSQQEAQATRRAQAQN